MKPSNGEIIEALRIIKQTCLSSEDCTVCPLRDVSNPNHCRISRDDDECPHEWTINVSEEWNAIK